MTKTFPCPLSVNSHDYMRMIEIYHRIMADLSQPIPTINELSKSVYMSPSKFRNMFVKIFGISIYQCHLSARMKLAMELLSDSNYTIEQIAYKVGFSRSQSFAKAFLLHIGCSPSQYRKAYNLCQK